MTTKFGTTLNDLYALMLKSGRLKEVLEQEDGTYWCVLDLMTEEIPLPFLVVLEPND